MTAQRLTLGFILCLSLTSHTANAESAELASSYTSLLAADCQTIDNDDFYQALCPANGDYQLMVYAGDLHSGIELSYDDHQINYEAVEPSQVGEVAEWRFSKQSSSIKYHALIYRISVAQINTEDAADSFLPPSDDKDQLVVLRLAETRSCLLGIIEQGELMNQKARELADDETAVCID